MADADPVPTTPQTRSIPPIALKRFRDPAEALGARSILAPRSARPCPDAGSADAWRGRQSWAVAMARARWLQLERAVRVPDDPGASRRAGRRAHPSRRSSPSASARASASRACSVLFACAPAVDLGAAGVEVEVDGLLRPLATLREMLERVERLLEAGGRLPVGRARHRLPSGLTEIADGLLPHLAPERVVGQALDVLREPLGVAGPRWPRPPGRGVRAGAPGGGFRRPPRGSGRA